MKQRKRTQMASDRAYLATKHKWTATFCKYTDITKSTLVEVQNVNGSGRVRVPRGWFVSFFMTDKETAKAVQECKNMAKKNRRRWAKLPSSPTFSFRSWNVQEGRWE